MHMGAIRRNQPVTGVVMHSVSLCRLRKCAAGFNHDSGKKGGYLIATNFNAWFVMAMDFAGSFSIPVIARMQSMFSTTTSASW